MRSLTMGKKDQSRDPYRSCEKDCTHDLAKGVLTDELLSGDGPDIGRWTQPSVLQRLTAPRWGEILRAAHPTFHAHQTLPPAVDTRP